MDRSKPVTKRKATSGSLKPGQTANPNGRPKKEESLTNLMRTYLNQIPPGEARSRKEIFIEKTAQLAERGDATAQKLIWSYLDGLPTQQVDVTSMGRSVVIPILGGLTTAAVESPPKGIASGIDPVLPHKVEISH